ncbi:UNVERIFIED_CONTAM: hypothetical protein NCL1_12167 [Trichonephila clavipes]
MAISKLKAFCVLQFAKPESAITMQRVLSSVVNLQKIITFLGGINSLKQLAVFLKRKVQDDQGCNW